MLIMRWFCEFLYKFGFPNVQYCSFESEQEPFTLIPPNLRILRVGIFKYVSLEPRVFSTKSGFQTRYLLNNKNSELENSASLQPRFREGLVYLGDCKL